ncbi:MAG: nucleoside phosphorylase [Kiritimatiellae bacterium]|nr:nucleoside phosphorylase [Kiritimatiellia bacterium]
MKKNAQPITGCGEGEIAAYAFLCGDPGRIPKVSAQWDDFEEVCRVREYVIHTGTKNGVRLSAASTGIGGPSTAIVLEEMAKLGAQTFIRIGNSGALADKVDFGDYVISTASVRDEGTSKSYIGADYPAAADFAVTEALVNAARQAGATFHTGITWSVDGFYSRNKVLGQDGGLIPMSFKGLDEDRKGRMVLDYKAAGVLNVEMESSTLFTLAGIYGLRAGCICTVSDRTPWPGPGADALTLDKNIDGAITIALNALLALA